MANLSKTLNVSQPRKLSGKLMMLLLILLTICVFSQQTEAKYAAGTGEPNDPYQIATAEDLMLLGDTPEDYDKHFILTADLDLDTNLPGRKVFDKAIIAPDTNDTEFGFQGTAFTGIFDGNDHIISHLTIEGVNYLGLFGQTDGSMISDLGLEAVDVNGIGDYVGGLVGTIGWGASITSSYVSGVVIGNEHVGGLVGYNFVSSITTTYSTGMVSGDSKVGGLVGSNGGSITTSHSTCRMDGVSDVGGLVGANYLLITFMPYIEGNISASYSTGAVSGETSVGGLVGYNAGDVTTSYSTGAVNGGSRVGGLVGANVYVGSSDSMKGAANGKITASYSTSTVTGNEDVGGLVGFYILSWEGDDITSSFWDMEASSQSSSAGGTGLTTVEMQDPNAFMAAGWDFIGQPDGPHDIWAEPEGGGYPVLFWQVSPEFGLPVFAGGTGEPNDPYLISTVEELNAIGHNPRLMDSHFKLIDDQDMTDCNFYPIGSYDFPCRSVFDGNGHTISHLMIEGDDYLGVCGALGAGATVKDCGVVDVNIISSGWWAGGL